MLGARTVGVGRLVGDGYLCNPLEMGAGGEGRLQWVAYYRTGEDTEDIWRRGGKSHLPLAYVLLGLV